MAQRTPPVVRPLSETLWLGCFEAMKSPCEVQLECADGDQARRLTELAAAEAWRIEEKFSRFLADSVIGRLNRSRGWMAVDAETMRLLKLADTCWRLTGGLIDVTIGGVMRLWRFDGRSPPPAAEAVTKALQSVGWENVTLRDGAIRLHRGVQLDFGGIGKEYAVDRVGLMLRESLPAGGILVNFGGDLLAARAKRNGQPWRVGLEAADQAGQAHYGVSLLTGAIATSGDTKRFAVDSQGKRLGHVLDPRSGWPVPDGPATVTVVGDSATQAGLLATCAMIKGPKAESFLQAEGLNYYIQWP